MGFFGEGDLSGGEREFLGEGALSGRGREFFGVRL
jgi:hypothetical protein